MNRLRWNNIARAAAVLAVVALVVAWPHLKGAPPTLPPAAATPVTVEDPALPAAPEQLAAETPVGRSRPQPRPRRRFNRHPVRRHRAPSRRRHRAALTPAVPAPARSVSPPAPPVAAPPPTPTPSADDLAAHEFAVP